jgi:hypothetical protein
VSSAIKRWRSAHLPARKRHHIKLALPRGCAQWLGPAPRRAFCSVNVNEMRKNLDREAFSDFVGALAFASRKHKLTQLSSQNMLHFQPLLYACGF